MVAKWNPPADWLRVVTIDAHTAGEPFRVVVSGVPEVRGETILERRADAKQRIDHLRRALMWEPRGHADMYGCLLTSPVRPDSDLGVLFMHNDGFSTMCGHGIIGIVTVAIETGMLSVDGETPTVRIDTPAGQVVATAVLRQQRVEKVRFRNVPSFILVEPSIINVDGVGSLEATIAFGGAFYAFVSAPAAGLRLKPGSAPSLIAMGRAIKAAVAGQVPITHPFDPDMSFLYGVIFVDEPEDPAHHSRNVCIFAEGELDRCPTGTGVSARLAIEHHLNGLPLDEWIAVESILGTTFRGRALEEVDFGPFQAVVPEVEGSAHITGRHEFLIDPHDPLGEGFFLR